MFSKFLPGRCTRQAGLGGLIGANINGAGTRIALNLWIGPRRRVDVYAFPRP